MNSKQRDIFFNAVNCGDIKLLQSLIDDGYTCSVYDGYLAASNGDINTLNFLIANKCKMDEYTWVFAILKIKFVDAIRKLSPLGNSEFQAVEELYFLAVLAASAETKRYNCDDYSYLYDYMKSLKIKLNINLSLKYALVKNDIYFINWCVQNNFYINSIEIKRLAGHLAQPEALYLIG